MNRLISDLCCGCLCAGRKTIRLDEYWIKDCFLQILNEEPSTPPINPAHLCWECEALLRKFVKFKSQVKQCCQILKDYSDRSLDTSTLKRSPRLCISEALIASIPSVFDIRIDSVKLEKDDVTNDIKEEDNISTNSENLEVDKALIGFKIKKKKRQVKEKRSKKKKDQDVIEEIELSTEELKGERVELAGKEEYVNDIKEEDNISTNSDDLEDDKALIEFNIKKKKRKVIEKKSKKKKEQNVIEEIELSTEELKEERVELAGKEEYVNAMFKCETCIVSFPNADDLKDHLTIKHDQSKPYQCGVCGCTFASEVSYNYHWGRHIRRCQCASCHSRFHSRRAALKHYGAVHAGSNFDYSVEDSEIEKIPKESNDSSKQMFPCEHCPKSFRWKTSLRKHLETHRIEAGQKRKPYCEPCRLSFTTTSNLQKHVKTSSKHQIQLKLWKLKDTLPEKTVNPEKHKAHIEQIKCSVNSARQQFVCGQCGRRFQWRGNLRRHMHTHTDRANGELVCAPCNRTFSSQATYTQHMKISKKHVSENDFKYICNECGKRFANKTRLKDHQNWEHLKNYVHTCDLCQKVFKSHTSLYLHKQVVHNKDSGEHLCDHCGKHFPNQAKLRCHIVAVHSASAPYKCSVCCARFSWRSCLSRHSRRLHRGIDNGT